MSDLDWTNVLGVHWLLDATDCKSPSLADPEALRAILTDLPEALSLTRVGEPQVFGHQELERDDATVAGIVLIAESHISIHCRPHLRTVHADIFSCKPFDVPTAREYLEKSFDFSEYEESVFERGRIGEGKKE